MSTDLKQDILNITAESKCNTSRLSHSCADYKELNSIIKKFKRRLKRAKMKYDKLKCKEKDLSKYGQWEIGYWKGQIATLEDCIDDLEEVR